MSDKAIVAAAIVREKKSKKSSAKAASAKKAKKINPQGKPKRTISDDEGETDQFSEASIDDVSCHSGDGDSPYESEWAHSSSTSAPATPVLGNQLQPSDDPIHLTLTPASQVANDVPRHPLNNQLAPNLMVS